MFLNITTVSLYFSVPIIRLTFNPIFDLRHQCPIQSKLNLPYLSITSTFLLFKYFILLVQNSSASAAHMPPRAMASVTGDFFSSFTIKYIFKKCFGLEISQFLPSNQSILQPWSVARLSLPTPSFCSKIFWLLGCWWFGKKIWVYGKLQRLQDCQVSNSHNPPLLETYHKKREMFSWHDVSMDGQANTSTFCNFTSALPYQSRGMDQRFYVLPSLGAAITS